MDRERSAYGTRIQPAAATRRRLRRPQRRALPATARVPVLAVLALAVLTLAATSPTARAQQPAQPGEPTRRAAESDPVGRRALTLESVEVSGNRRTPEFVVVRHLALFPGDELTTDILEAARQRLILTDYFTSVSLSTRRGGTRGSVVLYVEVEERGNPVFETGFGYHDLNGWYLTLLGMRLDNALGADSQTRVGLRAGFRLFGFDAEWRKPIASDGRMSLGLKLMLYSTQQIFYGDAPAVVDTTGAWTGFQQNVARAGGEFVFGYRTGDRSRIELGLSAITIHPDNAFKTTEDKTDLDFSLLPPELQQQNRRTTISGLLVRAVRDTRNNSVYPTRGTLARATINVNGTILGGDEIFSKGTIDLRGHAHVGNGWVLSTHASTGVTTRETPYYERFYIGGNYSIRGFREWSLSPTAGHDGFWAVSQELRWPLAGPVGQPKLAGLVFADAGQGWRHGESVSTDTVHASAGYGLRVMLPWLGTLGLDVGIPLTDSPTNDRFRAHLLLGFSF